MKKLCNSCKIEKPLDDFYKDKKGKYGVKGCCKECVKEKHREYDKKYYEENKEKRKEYFKKHRQENKEYYKKYYQENKEKLKETFKKWRQENKEQIKEYKKKYRQENKEKIKEKHKEYCQENKEQLKEKQREYQKNRMKTDPLFKLKCNLRTRTYKVFKSKGYSKNTKTQKMLGVDWEVCKAHIERQFTKGMNWDNYGEWHVDHIIPLASATTEKRLKELCHYTNLQPLWADDNISKRDKIINQQTMLRI